MGLFGARAWGYTTQELKAYCHNPGFGRSLLTGVLVILTVATSLWAHSEPPPPPPPPPEPPPPLKFPPQVLPLRWSWLHWWEANRELYLRPVVQGMHRQDTDPTLLDALRAEAVSALLKAIEDDDVVPRGVAALALGRIGAPAGDGVVEKLGVLAQTDVSEDVRFHAVLAIGMIGDEACEEFLRKYRPSSFKLRTAAVIATGFIHSPTQATHDGLRTLLNDPSPAIRGAALWALSQHAGSIDEGTAMSRVLTEQSPWLVSTAELTLGDVAADRGVRLLIQILQGDQPAESLPAWALLKSLSRKKAGPINPQEAREWRDAHQRLYALDPIPLRPGEHPPNARTGRMVYGIEQIYMSRLRSSAAIALGEVGNQPGVVDALRRVLGELDDDYNTQPKCFALISLGKIGAHEGLADMLEVLSDRDGRRPKPQKVLESPLRGFAAIGLGLYARPYDSTQGQANHAEYEKALELLRERLADEREKLEVRAACAVALGLAGRTVSLKTLVGGYESFDEANPLLGGYVLLARALLGDRNLIEPVSAAMARKHYHDETTDLLARRAAVLALGASGTGEVIPHLIRFWDEPYHVNREVILALSLCNAEGVSQYVLPGVNGKGNKYERAYLAEVVGRMLSRSNPQPLSRFLIGSNFTVRDGLLEPYRTLGNPFLYMYLIPQFEDTWY